MVPINSSVDNHVSQNHFDVEATINQTTDRQQSIRNDVALQQMFGNKILYCKRIKTMVNFVLGKEIEEVVFRLVTSVGQKKIVSPHRESNLRP